MMWKLTVLICAIFVSFSGNIQEEDATSKAFMKHKGKLICPMKRGTIKAEPNSKFSRGDESFKVRITGPAGSKAVAVFKGEVYNIAELRPGVKTVMIRHGSYMTLYSNLVSVSVTRGMAVKKSAVLGTAQSDAGGEAVLVFSMRRQGQNLNPRHWLKIR